MDVLDLFSSWLFSCWTVITTTIFTGWGFLGSALFAFILLRKLIKVFKNTF